VVLILAVDPKVAAMITDLDLLSHSCVRQR